MKLTELDEGIGDWLAKDETIGDWLAKKGLFGRKAGIAATARELSKTHGDLMSQARELEKEKFKKQLSMDLEHAIAAGLVTIGIVPENMEYKDFDTLLESRILTEAMSVADFMTTYVKNLTAKMKLSTEQETFLNTLIASFSANYRGPSKVLPAEADKLWNALQSIKALQGAQKSKLGDFGYPAPGTKVEVQGHEYTFVGTNWKDSSGNVINVEDDVKALNKKAYEERFAAKPPPHSVPYASAMHGTQYKWAYDPRADSWRGYPRNEPNPPVTAPIIVGNTDTRYAMLNKAYHSQSGI